ncbi:MAG TPA: His/Gly/Thr/Pro-type tRNA ligase C-terminal domain-containing protein, partial [Candidatus Tumulicola sp.]|nr:His/Gly/Thr/Pro-type tRNA ligase C-terminal domain-containing protein [Candidatus Tumulicola sp.]
RAIAVCRQAAAELENAGFRVRVDARDQQPGWKYGEWDVRGVPVRIDVGPRDVEAGTAVLVRRDRAKGDPQQKASVSLEALARTLRATLDDVEKSLYAQAAEFLRTHTVSAGSRDEFFAMCTDRAGMIDIPWCRRPECEARVKAETGATTRNLRPLAEGAPVLCVACGEPAVVSAYFAQSY